MRARVCVAVAVVVMGLDVHVAHAQWKEAVRVSINAGSQLSSTTFTSTTSFPVYLEMSNITTSYTAPKGQLFDGGLLFRLKGSFGVGVAISSYSERHDAPINASIPHPFFFNTPRTLTATAANLQRNELAAHIQVAYVIASSRLDVAISGGPSIFRVGQDLVSNVSYTETYPYDTVTFTGATTVRAESTKLGFNVGVDLGYRLSGNVGVGGLVRFSRATSSFLLPGSSADVTADAGGVQVAGGVRFYF